MNGKDVHEDHLTHTLTHSMIQSPIHIPSSQTWPSLSRPLDLCHPGPSMSRRVAEPTTHRKRRAQQRRRLILRSRSMTGWRGGHAAIVGLILIYGQAIDEPISVLERRGVVPYVVLTGGGERGAVGAVIPRVSGPGSAKVGIDDLVDSLVSGRVGTWKERDSVFDCKEREKGESKGERRTIFMS